jgi:hypothetical protein
VDLYSSTRSALHCFEGDDALFLPRVVCYFDDLMSADLRYSCEDVGEMLAIREFNDQATRRHRVRGGHDGRTACCSSLTGSNPWRSTIGSIIGDITTTQAALQCSPNAGLIQNDTGLIQKEKSWAGSNR